MSICECCCPLWWHQVIRTTTKMEKSCCWFCFIRYSLVRHMSSAIYFSLRYNFLNRPDGKSHTHCDLKVPSSILDKDCRYLYATAKLIHPSFHPPNSWTCIAKATTLPTGLSWPKGKSICCHWVSKPQFLSLCKYRWHMFFVALSQVGQ